MQINEERSGGALVVRLAGRLDSQSAPALEAVLPARAQVERALVVDLADVPYVSSAGLRILLKSAKTAKASGAKLVLSGLAAPVREVFDISGFTALFTLRDTAAEGLAALA